VVVGHSDEQTRAELDVVVAPVFFGEVQAGSDPFHAVVARRGEPAVSVGFDNFSVVVFARQPFRFFDRVLFRSDVAAVQLLGAGVVLLLAREPFAAFASGFVLDHLFGFFLSFFSDQARNSKLFREDLVKQKQPLRFFFLTDRIYSRRWLPDSNANANASNARAAPAAAAGRASNVADASNAGRVASGASKEATRSPPLTLTKHNS